MSVQQLRDRLANADKATVAVAAFYLALCLIWTGLLATKITDRQLNPDAAQNVRMASHVAHYWFFSFDRYEPPKHPTMEREPIPVFALAAWILINPELSNVRPYQEFGQGRTLVSLKKINLFWAFFLHFGMCVLIFSSSSNLMWRLVVPPFIIVMTNLTFLNEYVDKLLTQLPAGCFLAWGTACMLLFVQRPTRRRAVILGISLALLALTKAVFFYVSLGAIIVLSIQMYTRREAFETRSPLPSFRILRGRRGFPILGFVLLSFLGVIGIWVVRNAIELHQFRIADRGGDVLYMRVLTMQKPVLGGLYAYAPRAYQPWIGKMTGYQRKDIKSGGRLADLSAKNPEEDIRKKRWKIYKVEMEKAGVKFRGRNKAQGWLAREGLKRYVSDPVALVGWIPVYAMRGSFFLFDELTNKAIYMHLTVLLILNFLVVSFVSLFRSRIETCAVFLLPLGLYLFHAMFTHGLARYNEPMVPFVWLALVYTVSYLGNLVARSWREHREQPISARP